MIKKRDRTGPGCRHDAGHDIAIEHARKSGLRLPPVLVN